jgi:hypothetical protein
LGDVGKTGNYESTRKIKLGECESLRGLGSWIGRYKKFFKNDSSSLIWNAEQVSVSDLYTTKNL